MQMKAMFVRRHVADMDNAIGGSIECDASSAVQAADFLFAACNDIERDGVTVTEMDNGPSMSAGDYALVFINRRPVMLQCASHGWIPRRQGERL